jgi:hypothetical protein
MRYPASEKLEIIRLVEESTLPVRRTLEKIGIPHATFYRWYGRWMSRRCHRGNWPCASPTPQAILSRRRRSIGYSRPPDVEEPHSAGELLPAGRSGSPDRGLRGRLQPPPLPREHRQSNPGRRLLRTRPDNPAAERKDQTPDHHTTPLAPPTARRVTSSTRRARASLNLHCSLSQNLC